MSQIGKNITFYASPEVLKALDRADLQKGDKSGYIGRAILAYSKLHKIEEELELALTTAVTVYTNVSGLSIQELAGELAKQKRLARAPEELYG